MDYIPYEDSLAAINGLPVDLESKPATDFATYIQTLLDNPAPRGFMLSGRAPATAEEELELKKAEEAIKKLVPASMFSEGGGEAAPTSNTPGISLGIGSLTDAHNQSVVQSAFQGALTGGLPGAITNAMQTHVMGLLGNLSYINDMPDPLGTLSALQGWSPVPVDNLSTPSTMFSDSNTSTIADGGYQGPTSSIQGPVGGVTVGGPMTAEVNFSVEDSGGGSSVGSTDAADAAAVGAPGIY